ncbi:MAG: YgiQ family radical SAM protein [Clostridia bacterium]|nr:YgiQ family radical SAM protein [Clostridia bacterium]
MGFLPVSAEEMKTLGWETYDFLLISGDAYVDHPSFGHAVISRVLEAAGYRVAVLPQPDWHSTDDVLKLGRPRLGVMISCGNIDSMVNHYTAAKKKRRGDVYSPGGKGGMRPDRCAIVYTNLVRQAFGGIPVIIGGIEASLRRFAHYDYWDNKVRRSILFDSRADIIAYGMGERQIVAIADALNAGIDVKDISWIEGTAVKADKLPDDAYILPSYEQICEDKKAYAEATREEFLNQDPIRGKILAQAHGDKYLIQNRPQMPLTSEEFDSVYELPYTREYHPMYESEGGIPALKEVKFSITSARGCYGNCNFCSLAFHQGRIVTSRSHDSIIREAVKMTDSHDFKGYIHDVGGPSANFRFPACDKQLKAGACRERQCLFPTPCKNMKISHKDYAELLAKLRALPKIKQVFVRSGIRYDYLLADKDESFFYDLCRHHISGQLKVAPEHVSDNVLYHMGKPKAAVYEKFAEKFYKITERVGKEQYLVPYLMSSHPGSTLEDAVKLAQFLKKHHMHPQQVQDFYPTPATVSTAMFYTGLDPMTMKEVYVPKSPEEKAMQRALLQFDKPDNYNLVLKALQKAGREDLIGFSENALIKPRRNKDVSKNIGRQGGSEKNKGRARRGSKENRGNQGRKTGSRSSDSRRR